MLQGLKGLRSKGWIGVLLLNVLFISNSYAAVKVKGNGNVATKQVEISDYNAIRIDGLVDFNYEQSEAEPYLEITIDENLHGYLNVEIKDRVLTVGFNKGVKVEQFTKFVVKTNSKWLKEVRAAGNANFMVNSPLTGDETVVKANTNCLIQFKNTVHVGKLDLNVSGSANMVVDDIEANSLDCSISGSGSITIKNGKAEAANYSITSSGDIHAFGLQVPELTCKITGNGLAEVFASERINASIIGKGIIRYKGATAVQQKIIGKGTIEEVK
ncbi:MAG: DUF2807 domain-containing protein [Tannerellaceae bacterium]|nr:DUF2807 domain-containing protein [Tannerellaceae bacterium]